MELLLYIPLSVKATLLSALLALLKKPFVVSKYRKGLNRVKNGIGVLSSQHMETRVPDTLVLFSGKPLSRGVVGENEIN